MDLCKICLINEEGVKGVICGECESHLEYEEKVWSLYKGLEEYEDSPSED